QVSGAHILHGVGNRSICLWVDPRFQSIRAMILDELCEVAPSCTHRAAGSRCDLFDAGTVGEQFKGGLFGIVRLAVAFAARTAPEGGVQRQAVCTAMRCDEVEEAVCTAMSGDEWEEALPKIGELAFPDAANTEERDLRSRPDPGHFTQSRIAEQHVSGHVPLVGALPALRHMAYVS